MNTTIEQVEELIENGEELTVDEYKIYFNNLTDEEKIGIYERYIYDNEFKPFYRINWLEECTSKETWKFIINNTDILEKYDYYYVNELNKDKYEFVTEKDIIEEAENNVSLFTEEINDYINGNLLI